jgi:hypothetical protein
MVWTDKGNITGTKVPTAVTVKMLGSEAMLYNRSLPTLQTTTFSFSIPKMEAAGLFEKLLTIYQTPQHYNPEDYILEGNHFRKGQGGTRLKEY